MIASYIIWYIVVGHPAGVFIFLWLWIMIGFYGLLKFPKFVIVGKSSRCTGAAPVTVLYAVAT